jgi:hypothetical protein
MLLRRLSFSLLCACFFTALLALPVEAGVPGSFRGTVREGADIKPGWIYVEALNGNLRLVDVRGAAIHYEDVDEGDDTAPPRVPGRRKPQLKSGTEVRVTAEQDRRGYWHASEVEVIRETSKK